MLTIYKIVLSLLSNTNKPFTIKYVNSFLVWTIKQPPKLPAAVTSPDQYSNHCHHK